MSAFQNIKIENNYKKLNWERERKSKIQWP